MDKHLINTEVPVSAAPKKIARIEVLDVLRGFALLGIFLMNIEYFNRPFQEFGQDIPLGTSSRDYTLTWLTEIFVTGKFWVLFSLLFGMGFVLMQSKTERDEGLFEIIYLRRTTALLVFGLLHAVLLWPGDILHSYALAAFVLMWLPIMSARSSYYRGLLLYLIPALLILLSGVVPNMMTEDDIRRFALKTEATAKLAKYASNIYASADYWQVTQQRWQDFMEMLYYEVYVVISALGIFLVGAGIMRSGRLLDLRANRAFFLKAMLVFAALAALLIGMAQSIGSLAESLDEDSIREGLMTIGNLPLSLFYLSTIAYAMSFASGRKILGVLAPAGKMALTNYVMQSLIASMVFYGYGLGQWQQWGRADLALFVLLVFTMQVILSHLWLRYFRYGPMEWLWRALTYWKLPGLRVYTSKSIE
jgi:uncharacterized protein